MPRNWSQSVVWITGASSGIGEQLAIGLAPSVAGLALSGRHTEALDTVTAKCRALSKLNSDAIRAVPFDIARTETIENIVRNVTAPFGRIDVLVLCAGVSQRAPAAKTSRGTLETIMATNFFGPVELARQVLPHMPETGTIAVVTSPFGKFGYPDRSAYAASKHALHGYFESLELEMAKSGGPKILYFLPGYVRTNIDRNALTGDGRTLARTEERHKKAAEPGPVAEALKKAIETGVRQASTGIVETGALVLNRLCPSLLRSILKRRG
ncbi:MAG: SDR family NAD(P)-dependent oxidoreductase [Hyphomicrobiales bacterium]|nr:SDR family NAD(P)-dependent oxidoreductase [Hyphomicrobiales bacterium]